jgi:hypothetical protein
MVEVVELMVGMRHTNMHYQCLMEVVKLDSWNEIHMHDHPRGLERGF